MTWRIHPGGYEKGVQEFLEEYAQALQDGDFETLAQTWEFEDDLDRELGQALAASFAHAEDMRVELVSTYRLEEWRLFACFLLSDAPPVVGDDSRRPLFVTFVRKKDKWRCPPLSAARTMVNARTTTPAQMGRRTFTSKSISRRFTPDSVDRQIETLQAQADALRRLAESPYNLDPYGQAAEHLAARAKKLGEHSDLSPQELWRQAVEQAGKEMLPRPGDFALSLYLAAHKNEPHVRQLPFADTDEHLTVEPFPCLTDEAVREAKLILGKDDAPHRIAVVLTESGRKIFTAVTKQNIGKKLAIVVDGEVVSAPVIMDSITQGRLVITGGLSEAKARKIADAVNAYQEGIKELIEALDPQTKRTALGDAVTEHLVSAINQHPLPFITQEKLAKLGAEFAGLVTEYVPENLSKSRKQAILKSLENPRHLPLNSGDIRALNRTYLNFPDTVKTLKWKLFMALSQSPLTAEQQQALSEQREWMRETVRNLPEDRFVKRADVLKDLQARFNDPLCIPLARPMSRPQFERFKKEIETHIREARTGVEEHTPASSRSITPHNPLPHMTFKFVVEALRAQYHKRYEQGNFPLFDDDRVVSFGAHNGYVQLGFQSNRPFRRTSRSLDDVEKGYSVVEAATGYVLTAPKEAREPGAFRRWLRENGKGDFAYDSAKGGGLFAVRNARLVLLDGVKTWYEADAIADDALRERLDKDGQDLVPLKKYYEAYVEKDKVHPSREFIGPYIGILTQKGVLAVVHVEDYSGLDIITYRVRTRGENASQTFAASERGDRETLREAIPRQDPEPGAEQAAAVDLQQAVSQENAIAPYSGVSSVMAGGENEILVVQANGVADLYDEEGERNDERGLFEQADGQYTLRVGSDRLPVSIDGDTMRIENDNGRVVLGTRLRYDPKMVGLPKPLPPVSDEDEKNLRQKLRGRWYGQFVDGSYLPVDRWCVWEFGDDGTSVYTHGRYGKDVRVDLEQRGAEKEEIDYKIDPRGRLVLLIPGETPKHCPFEILNDTIYISVDHENDFVFTRKPRPAKYRKPREASRIEKAARRLEARLRVLTFRWEERSIGEKGVQTPDLAAVVGDKPRVALSPLGPTQTVPEDYKDWDNPKRQAWLRENAALAYLPVPRPENAEDKPLSREDLPAGHILLVERPTPGRTDLMIIRIEDNGRVPRWPESMPVEQVESLIRKQTGRGLEAMTSGDGANTKEPPASPAAANPPGKTVFPDSEQSLSVIDAAGQPVAGARVRFEAQLPKTDRRGNKRQKVLLKEALSDADGKVPIPDVDDPKVQTINLRVQAEGYVPRRFNHSAQLTRRRDNPENPWFTGAIDGEYHTKLVLLEAGTITGRVLDADGQPLAGASLSMTTHCVYSDYWQGDGKSPSNNSYMVANHLRAITDENGEYRFDGVPPGELLVYYPWEDPIMGEVKSGRWRQWTEPGQRYPQPPVTDRAWGTAVTFKEGQSLTDLDVDLSRSTAQVDGQVVDKAGQPVPDASVHAVFRLDDVRKLSWPDSFHRGRATTDADGRFRLSGLPLGTFGLYVKHDQLKSPETAPELELESDRTSEIRITLPDKLLPDDVVNAWRDDASAKLIGLSRAELMDRFGKPLIVNGEPFEKFSDQDDLAKRFPEHLERKEVWGFQFRNVKPDASLVVRMWVGEDKAFDAYWSQSASETLAFFRPPPAAEQQARLWTPWSDPVDGLRWRIGLAADTVKVGQKMAVHMEFRNQSDKALRILKQPTVSDNLYPQLYTSDGQSIVYSIEHNPEAAIKLEDTVLIKPGQAHKTKWAEMATKQPGPAKLRISYVAPKNTNPEVENFWSGRLPRQTLEFTVLRPDGSQPEPKTSEEGPAVAPGDAAAVEARKRFIEVERFARRPKAEQAEDLADFYKNLDSRSISPMIERILSVAPRNILDRDPKNTSYDGNTERWAQQLADVAEELSVDQVADKLKSPLWLNIAARARALQVLRAYKDDVANLIDSDLNAPDRDAISRKATMLIASLDLRSFSQRLLGMYLTADDPSSAVLGALLTMKDPTILPVLLEKVKDEPASLLRISALLPGQLAGEPAPQELLELLDSPDADIRYHAAYALQACRDPALAEPAVKLADEKEARFREMAALWTAKLPEKAFTEVRTDLLPLLHDEDEEVCLAALRSFGQRRDPAAGPVILELLKRENLEEQHKITVMQAMSALSGKTWGYNMHAWGPDAPGNREAIQKFEEWLKDQKSAVLRGKLRTLMRRIGELKDEYPALKEFDPDGIPVAVVSATGNPCHLGFEYRHKFDGWDENKQPAIAPGGCYINVRFGSPRNPSSMMGSLPLPRFDDLEARYQVIVPPGQNGKELRQAVTNIIQQEMEVDNWASGSEQAQLPESLRPALETMKQGVLELAEEYPQLQAAENVEVAADGWMFEHDCSDMGKRGYRNTGPFPLAIGLKLMTAEVFDKQVHEAAMQIPDFRWENLGLVGWTTLYRGAKLPEAFVPKIQAVMVKTLKIMQTTEVIKMREKIGLLGVAAIFVVGVMSPGVKADSQSVKTNSLEERWYKWNLNGKPSGYFHVQVQLAENDRDQIVLGHEFVVNWQGEKKQIRTLTKCLPDPYYSPLWFEFDGNADDIGEDLTRRFTAEIKREVPYGCSPCLYWVDNKRQLVRVLMDDRKEFLLSTELEARRNLSLSENTKEE